jgi:hypothetical protein
MPLANPFDQGSISTQNPTLAQRLLEAGEPRFLVFEQQRRASRATPPPPPTKDHQPPGSSTATLSLPEETPSAIELLSESDAATWLVTHVRSAEDILIARIPAWGVEGVTTCILPKVIAQGWPHVSYDPVDRAEASCLRIKDMEGKGKGCVAARAVFRGETVARERALLVMPRTCISPRSFVGAATDMMTPNQRAAFFALHDGQPSDTVDTLGIISSNSFLISGLHGHEVLYSAVFETFSLLNHRCAISSRFMVPKC